jgi:hypothetical protein
MSVVSATQEAEARGPLMHKCSRPAWMTQQDNFTKVKRKEKRHPISYTETSIIQNEALKMCPGA